MVFTLDAARVPPSLRDAQGNQVDEGDSGGAEGNAPAEGKERDLLPLNRGNAQDRGQEGILLLEAHCA